MLPLSDGVPARRFPVVNVSLIAANFAVWLFYELPHLNSAVYHASFYPCTVDNACRGPEPWGVSGITAMFLHGSWGAPRHGAELPAVPGSGRGGTARRRGDPRGQPPGGRAAAESAVSGLTGVRNIKDEIQLVFDVDPADVNRRVREALGRNRVPPDDARVVARASGNTVMLGGRIRTRAQRDAVVAAAWRGHAVEFVIDELDITG